MRAFVIAGEPSGDRLGGALMAGLSHLHPGIEFSGVGGPMMTEQGLSSLFAMQELSIMGLVEVLPKYRHLKRRIAQTAQAVLDAKPDVLITIDSPDFCLRVARLVKDSADIRTVHYVAPSVWAWRPKRADKMAKVIDHVLALLPFEPPYMQAAGMECDFVGHPVVGEPVPEPEDIARFRAEQRLGRAPVLVALPGSRRSEVTRLAPVFGQALAPVVAAHPDLRIVVPAAAHLVELVQGFVADWPGAPLVLDPGPRGPQQAAADKRAAFAAAEVALAASGTVSLELAAAGTPMVVAYRPNWLTWQLAKRMVRIDTVTLVNLISDTRIVPECLGPDCNPGCIAPALERVMSDPDAQGPAMALTMDMLGRGGEDPGLRAARAVLDGLNRG